MKKYNILSSLFVAAVFGGCVSDYEPNYTGALSDKEISFKVSTANPSDAQAIVGQGGTRATDLQDGFLEPIKAISDYQKPLYLHTLISSVPDTSRQASRAIQYTEATDINSFGVLAYRYASGASATTPNFLYNSEFQKVGSKWSSVNKYYWPVNSDKLDFYAYAPYNNSAITLSAEDASGVPTMEFTVNPDASLQADLITAKALTQDLSAANTGVPLEFTHNLTTVKFILGEDMLGTVTSITFKNIYTDGKLTFGGAWNFNGKTRGDISVPYNTNTYLIPQVFSDQAQEIQVVYNDGLQSYTLHYKLQGTSWTAGKAVTYCINSSAVTQLKLGAINFDASLSEKPKRAWADGDAVGLYAIETATGTEKITNVKLTYSSSTGKWSLPANTTLLYTPKYEYYVYYPYQTAGLAHSATASAKQMTSRATTATSYFANGISSWTIPADQTNVATLNATDLQTSKGTVSASDAATLNFTMESEMTLCKVTLGSKNIPFTRTYTGNTNTYTDSGSKTVKAANNFNGGGIKPYHSGTSDIYYAIVKPGNISTQQLKCAANIANGWAKAPVTPNGTRRNMWSHTVQSDSTVIFMARAYSYTGSVQTFTAPSSTSYKMDCWGAEGGYSVERTKGGKGGYVAGKITLTSNVIFFIYVGQTANHSQAGGWNGGGNGTDADQTGYGGGGSTDIRTTSGNWNSFNSLKTRILIAAGGAGSGDYDDSGGDGGGLSGLEGKDKSTWYVEGSNYYAATGGTQTTAGNSNATNQMITINNKSIDISSSGVNKGGFGYGGSNLANSQYGFQYGGAGGGGGYYGGGASTRGHGGGGGGSSFISGHTGCNAITSSSTSSNIVHTGQPNHYSGYVFTNTIMKAGNESMPSPTGGTETGHSGNGYCKITWHPAI